MKLRLYETKKLQYGKYLYKLVINNYLAHIFRTEFQKDGNLGYARQQLDACNRVYNDLSKERWTIETIPLPWRSPFVDKCPVQDYFDAIRIYRLLKKQKDYKICVSYNAIYFYTNNRDVLVKIINSCYSHGELHEPKSEYIDKLLTGKNVILSDTPVQYKYKITLGSKLGNEGLAKWIRANPNLAKMGKLALNECLNQNWVKGYYFFVKDDKSLLIAQMIVGDNIARIDKILYRDE